MSDFLDNYTANRAERMRKMRGDILAYLALNKEAYSKEFRDGIPLDANIQEINIVCRRMEAEALLDSRFATPPHPDLPNGGGLARRYYRLRK